MKRSLFFLAILFLFSPIAKADEIKDAPSDKYYLGLMLGDPTGFSGKMKLDRDHSVDAALAGSNGRWPGLQIHGDYLFDPVHGWETDQGPLLLYYGMGARMISVNDTSDKGKITLGPRGSVGVTFNVHNPNIEFFGEGALVLDMLPEVDVDLDLAVGARVRF